MPKAKVSGWPIARMIGKTIGRLTASTKAPNTPPKAEEAKAAPMARFAWPCLANGCPSMMVACAAAVPGTPSRMEAIESLVLVTAIMPSSMAKAGTGSMPKVKGISSASPIRPPIPGTAPSQMPIRMPNIM